MEGIVEEIRQVKLRQLRGQKAKSQKRVIERTEEPNGRKQLKRALSDFKMEDYLK